MEMGINNNEESSHDKTACVLPTTNDVYFLAQLGNSEDDFLISALLQHACGQFHDFDPVEIRSIGRGPILSDLQSAVQ